MPAPATSEELLDLVRKTDVVDPQVLDDYLQQLRAAGPIPTEPKAMAGLLIRDGLLTNFQAGLFILGRSTGFTIGKYRILERLGTGGMGSVFLCEDRRLRRKVAVKVLPPRIAKDPASLARFQREAHVVAVLDHPNIVHAHDFCQDDNLYYLVMEYIDGVSLQELINKQGPLDVERSCHYIRQTAEGLQHAHEAGLIHRDIKPGNILVDRSGTVKVLDLGLARFTDDRNEQITTNFDDGSIMGTADYLAPEQAMSLHDVDIRADIYSLGMTFYFLLAGQAPYRDGSVPQKLLWHQMKMPTPIREVRPEVPEAVAAILEKMIAKDPAARFQTPGELAEALVPFTQTAAPLPPELGLRRLCPAALGAGPATTSIGGGGPPTMRNPFSWQLPENGSGPVTIRPRQPGDADRSRLDTPNPSALNTIPELRPVEEEKNGKSSRTPATPRKDDDDVVTEAVEDEPTSGRGLSHSSAIRRGEKGARKKGVGSSSTTLQLRKRRGKESENGIDWKLWIGSAASIVLFLALVGGFIVWRSIRSAGPDDPDNTQDNRDGSRSEVRPGSGKLFVSRTGQANSFPTLRAALEKALPGDRILVKLDVLQEALHVKGEDGKGKDVIIEAELPQGKPVIWRAPADHPKDQPLVTLDSVTGLRFKNFRLDGQKRLDDLVVISGRCPGLVLEDLHCDAYGKNAVRLQQCSGESARPVTLRRVRTTTAGNKNAEASVLLETGSDQLNQDILIEECRFEGPAKAALVLAGPTTNVVVQHNRFFRVTDGVLYRKPAAPPRLHLTLQNNTFATLERGLHLETMPLNDKVNKLAIKNNLFVGTKKLASADGVPTQPDKPPAQWIWFGEDQTAVPAENRYFRKSFDVAGKVAWASLNICADDSFTVWLNGEMVGKSKQPLFTRRVQVFPVTKQIKTGKNVLAVESSNAIDFTGKPTSHAGLLVQLSYNAGGKTPVIPSDKSWKASKTMANGWMSAEFNDSMWPAAKVLGAYNSKETAPFNNPVWESTSNNFFRGAAAPLAPEVTGNVRDHGSGEGYPLLDAQPGDIKLPSDPAKDKEQFLRYPKDSPLIKVGSPGVPPTP